MNKPVYLSLSIFEIRKIVMREFWYEYLKPKYGGKATLCYIDTDSFVVYIKTEHIYLDSAKGVETRFDTLNWINEKLIRWENNEIVSNIYTKHV